MRFLFINQYYLPDYAATAQQLADLCETLAGQGHDVHVLAGNRLYDGRSISLPETETIRGVQVHRVAISVGGRNRFRNRVQEYLAFYAKAFLKIHALPRPDVAVTLTSPPMISLLGTWLRLVRRSRFVYWVMDIYPDIAHRAGFLQGGTGIVRRTWSLLGRFSYLTANRVITLGDEMRDVLVRKGVPRKRIEVFPSWSCGGLIRPLPPAANPFRERHIRADRFTLMYSGNMGFCHTFRAVVDGVKALHPSTEHDFLFVGSGKRESELREKLAPCGDMVRFLPYQERESLGESLSAPDAHLITLDSRFDGLLVPSKLYGIMAAGRPIIYVGSEKNTIARTIDAAQCGIRVDPGESAQFVDAVRRLAADPQLRLDMGRRGREYFEQNCDRALVCNQMADFLHSVGMEKGARGHRTLAHTVHRTAVARVSDPSPTAALHLD